MGNRFGIAIAMIALSMLSLLPTRDAVAASPQAAFTSTMQTDAAGSLSVRLDATPSADAEGDVVLYQWVFGDGATGSGRAVVHTYPSSGTYLATLFVVDDQGETARITEQITVPIASPSEPSPPSSAHPASVRTDLMSGLSIGDSVGQLAPEFALDSLDGERFILSEARGSVVVLDFWSSGCGGCQATMPGLVAMQQQLLMENVLFVGISLDRDAASAARYIARYGFQGTTLWQSASASRSVMTRYGVIAVPTTLVIDASGVIRFRGYRSELDAQIVGNVLQMGDEYAGQGGQGG
ncbi:redoxin domain-containing protein [Candidatus Bipolaricaulota bacterium]|nr:redoxin domain-containing protein [Candidatus Bipolaricaulota bacterium]